MVAVAVGVLAVFAIAASALAVVRAVMSVDIEQVVAAGAAKVELTKFEPVSAVETVDVEEVRVVDKGTAHGLGGTEGSENQIAARLRCRLGSASDHDCSILH